MLVMLLTAQLMIASPPNPVMSYFTSDDVPINSLEEGRFYYVGFRLTVKPDGSKQSCETETASGSILLDRLTCSIAMQRARFRPAKGSDGTPQYSVVRSNILWTVNPVGSPQSQSDIEVSVNQLPPGSKSPTTLRVQFLVDRSGHVSMCEREKPSDNASLVSVACNQVMLNYVAKPAQNAEGVSQISVQDASVTFTKNNQH